MTSEMTVYLFVNPLSGLQTGKVLLEGGVTSIAFEELGRLYLVDLKSQKAKDSAYAQIKDFQSHSTLFPYIVVAGGDGTFVSVLDELIDKKVDPLKANFCTVPFGTGNDLAQVTGWGANADDFMKGNAIKSLRNFMTELKYATISSINIWEIEAKCMVLFL